MKTAAMAEKFIKPNDRLSSLERLEIYNRQYWFRLLDNLADDFPGVRGGFGGGGDFDRIAMRAYLERASFAVVYAAKPGRGVAGVSGRNTQGFDGIAGGTGGGYGKRFEWGVQVEAFDEAGYPPLGAGELGRVAGKGGRAKLSLQPYLRLLHLRYPLDDFLMRA